MDDLLLSTYRHGDQPILAHPERYMYMEEPDYRELKEKFENDFRVGMGAEAIKELLCELDLEQLSAQLKEELLTANGP